MDEVEKREIRFDCEVVVKAMTTGSEFHMVVTKGLLPEGDVFPKIVGARLDDTNGPAVVLEFDRPVVDDLMLMSIECRPPR